MISECGGGAHALGASSVGGERGVRDRGRHEKARGKGSGIEKAASADAGGYACVAWRRAKSTCPWRPKRSLSHSSAASLCSG